MTRKMLMIKWGLYALAALCFLSAQQLLLEPLFSSLWAAPFLAPMLVAVVAALEGPTGGSGFGLGLGILCDLLGRGVFAGAYTLSFFCIGLLVSIVAKYWVMRSVFGSLVYALLAFAVIDLIQLLYLMLLRSASVLAVLSLAGREIAVSLLFVIPIYFLYNALHKRFRFE